MKYLQQLHAFEPTNEVEFHEKRMLLEYVALFPGDILLRSNEIAHITSSALIVNPTMDKLLLIHHNIYQTWAWTGGHADGDDDLFLTAMREAMEETGAIRLTPVSDAMLSLDILPVWGHMKKGRYICPHMHLNASYVLICPEDEPLQVNIAETRGVMWVPVNELENYSNEPVLIALYRKLVEKAKRFTESAQGGL